MSRIGKAPIDIRSGVEVKIENSVVSVKGPKGSLSHVIPSRITVKKVDNQLLVERASDLPEYRSLHGLTRSLLNNMVKGVSVGFKKELQLVGVGYRAKKQGNNLEILVGYSKPVSVVKPEGIEFDVPVQTKIIVKGVDKQLVGQVASNIRAIRPPEPYKGKGIKYIDEQIRRKAGKAAKAEGGA